LKRDRPAPWIYIDIKTEVFSPNRELRAEKRCGSPLVAKTTTASNFRLMVRDLGEAVAPKHKRLRSAPKAND